MSLVEKLQYKPIMSEYQAELGIHFVDNNRHFVDINRQHEYQAELGIHADDSFSTLIHWYYSKVSDFSMSVWDIQTGM